MTDKTKNQLIIVDDEISICKMLQKGLACEGTEINIFDNAKDAIEFAKNNHVDVVIADQRMPGMKGSQLCVELKKIDLCIQFVIITAVADKEVIKHLLSLGIVDILIKPFTIKQLRPLLDMAYARAARFREFFSV